MTSSAVLYQEALRHIPGGVNSPVRAFRGVGGEPVFIQSARGPHITDTEGREYIDYVGAFGPMIAGHAHPAVIAAVKTAAEKGLGFGAPTEAESQLAEKICQMMPAIEQVRMVNSGTEATMTAIRLARGFTGREKIIKFAGCYHGHADAVLVEAGSGALTLGVPGSAGVPQGVSRDTLVADYNDANSVKALFEKYGREIAAVIVEPVAGNMNCILPAAGFLAELRELCDRFESVLILDEVMTGFRVAKGGAQALYGIRPDLVTLGKVIGGGLPVGACGGCREIMQHLAPCGNVYQAGTLSGNPLAMAAGLATLDIIDQPGFYEKLSAQTEELTRGLEKLAAVENILLKTVFVGGMFGIFFSDKLPQCFAEIKKCNVAYFQKFFHGMLAEGIYFAPSAFEAGFVSGAHTGAETEKTLRAAQKVFETDFRRV